jgi:hypothetical protein
MDIPVEILKRTICYYYLLAYCPPENVKEFKKGLQPLRREVAKGAGMKMKDFFAAVPAEVSRHIVAFHQNTHDPDQEWVDALAKKMKGADGSPTKVAAYQEMMGLVARLPQRARPENRLHSKRGCQFCAAPCHYGYFTLVSEPDFEMLEGFLEHEGGLATMDRKPVMAVTSFALTHIVTVLKGATEELYIHQAHLANLAYCLLALATAKSRRPFPEEQVRLFQAANQYFIDNPVPAGTD